MHGPDPRRPARRDVVAAIIGAELGAAIGLLGLGATPLAPLGMAALGAVTGAGTVRLRNGLMRRWLRDQLRTVR
jgi:hypothetical protein